MKWKFKERLSNLIERHFPRYIVVRSKEALQYSGIEMMTGIWILFSIVNSVLLGILGALIMGIFLVISNLWVLLGFTLVFASILFAAFHNVLLYYGKRRAVQIEEMMPDSLQLIAANIRADIPIHKALMLSARPEFGLLAKEMDFIGREILSGKATDIAFGDFGKRVKSPLVSRIATLMEEGLKSGHDMAGMMEQVAYDIRMFKVLEDEANANISSYVVFIMMAVLVIAPVLYSISISFIDLSDQVKETLDVGSLVQEAGVGGASPLVGLVGGERGVSADTLVWFAGINLAVSAGIAAILISVLQTGEALQKLPYVPGFIIFAVVFFIIVITVLRTILGGLIV